MMWRRFVICKCPGFTHFMTRYCRCDRSAERKQEVQKAAQEAAETGVAVETGLTSDKTVPESVQRGRNSRTGPLSNKE